MNTDIKVILGGDVMLGRMVKDIIASEGMNYPMEFIAPIMRQGDLTIINLECAITSHEQLWHGAQKAFYFGAPPAAADIIKNCGVDLVSLANNHILDFDYAGLLDTLHYLKLNHVKYTGAGRNANEAYQPACLVVKNTKFGMTAFCDHQADFAALENSPGMAHLAHNDENKVLEQLHSSLVQMQTEKVDWPILSLHWGPNMVLRPSTQFVRIAHAAIDMGYKIIFGHSAHVFHGIEIYKGYPIIYAAGDLVDDYYVDTEFKNDHQLLFEINIQDNVLHHIKLYPVFIANCQTKPADHEQFAFIQQRMKLLCKEFGTTVHTHDNISLIITPGQ